MLAQRTSCQQAAIPPLCAVPRAVCRCCRCSELEGKRLQDSERLTAVNTELSKLKDLYRSKKGEAVRWRGS
jgi:hypothetical protein